MLEKFLEFVNDSRGKISSQRFREEYFLKMNKKELWEWFIEETEQLDGYQNSEKMFLLCNGFKEPPRCYCGNPVLVIVGPKGRISEYCCTKCAQKSITRAQKLSITKNERNKDLEYKIRIETKRKNTMLEKYGVEYNSQRPEVKELLHFKQNFLELPINIIIDEYLSGFSLVALGEKYDVDYSTIRNRLVLVGFDIRLKTNSSIFEDRLSCVLIENNIQHERNIYSIIKKTKQLELDFVMEKYKLAVEINGLYWHSFGVKETKEQKEKHLFKTEQCKEKGYRLFHFTDYQITHKLPIIISMIKNHCGTSDKIYGRNTELCIVEPDKAKEFFEINHLQGNKKAKLYIGLKQNDVLLSVGSFGTPNYSNKFDWEIIRFATLLNHSVIGGFSKILKYFQQKNKGTIISYADRQWSNGDVYEKNGFILDHITPPGYGWTDGGQLYNRMKFQKYKLEGLIPIFDKDKSEQENMFNNGYKRFWDCGQLVYKI